MQPFSLLFLLFLLDALGSKAAPSTSLPVDPHPQGMTLPSKIPTGTLENSTRDWPTPEYSATVPPESSKTLPSAPYHTSRESPRETPSPSLSVAPETLVPAQLMTSVTGSQEASHASPSKATLPESPETPKPDLTTISQSGSPDTQTPNTFKASLPESPEAKHTDPMPATHQGSPEIPKADTPQTFPGEGPKVPSPVTTQLLGSLETYDLSASSTLNSASPPATSPGPTETPQSSFLFTHNPNATDTPQTELPTTLGQNATGMAVSSGLPTQPTATFREEVTTPGEPGLSSSPRAPATTHADIPGLSTSDSPGTKELNVPHSSPKGPDSPPPLARIAGRPAPQAPNQIARREPQAPQRHSRGGETVSTIILVERVKETGVTLVSRPRGSISGALCLFLAGTGMLIGVFLLLWCLYRRASRHRSFAHHRLQDSGDEPVLHLETPKDPSDLYFYAPDAWVPSHIATRQPPRTPALPPKLPPPPRGPQRLEALSPAALSPNFV